MNGQDIYLSSKPRYEILDALRGVAALLVVAFHLFEPYAGSAAGQIINHGYLAVDFFFLLSGFVIGYAYDDRWDRMTTLGFFKRRLVRLHPMVVMGTLIGACAFFLPQGDYFGLMSEAPVWKFFLCLFLALLMIPCAPGLDIRGWSETNPFNGPNWSLTYEYIANILYALIFRHLPKLVLALLCVCCAFFTLDLTLGWDVFGLFPSGPQYNVIGGWCLTPQQIYVAFSRLLYPFLCGLLISRILASRSSDSNPSGSPIHITGGFWFCSFALAVLMCMPCIGGKSGVADGIYQSACILILFPLIILSGAGSVAKGERSRSFCNFLGNISYPLYITHYPLIYMYYAWARSHPDAALLTKVILAVGVYAAALYIAYASYKLYDSPVRKYLTDRFLKKQK